MPTFLSSWQLNLIPLGPFRVLMPIFLNSAATKPGPQDHSGFSCQLSLNSVATKPGPQDHSGFSCRTFLSILWQLNLVPKTIPGSHAELFLTQPVFQWQLNQGHFPTLQVLMPISLYLLLKSPGMTPGSVAPRTVHSVRPSPQLQPDQPVEMYFSLTTFQYRPMQRPAVQPISFLILSTVSSGSPGSLSLCQNHQALPSDSPGSLSLSAKVTYSQIQATTLPCTATATRPHAAQLLTLISYAHHSCKRLNLATFVTCQKMLSLRKLNLNAHSNLSELCDIDQVCCLSIPRIGTVARFPGSSSYP